VYRVGLKLKAFVYLLPASVVNSKGNQHLTQGPPVSDEDLKTLSKIKHVVGVSLSDHHQATNDGLRWLGEMKELKCLMLEQFDITDVGLAHLQNIKSLEVLIIKAGQFSDAALLEFKNALPDCEVTLVQTDE
jgi:hypothetical protein